MTRRRGELYFRMLHANNGFAIESNAPYVYFLHLFDWPTSLRNHSTKLRVNIRIDFNVPKFEYVSSAGYNIVQFKKNKE